MTKELFAVSTADAYLINPDTDTLVSKGTAVLTSTMEQTNQASEIFAGRGSQLKTVHKYQKQLAFSIEVADFSPTYLAIQTGSEIKNELSAYFTDEKVEFDAQGVGTLSKTPIGNVYVEQVGNHTTFAPSGSSITVPSLAGKSAKVAYQYNETVDVLTIPANSFPKALKLVLVSDIFDADGDKAYEQQIIAERYSLDGAISMTLTHDSASTFTLNGKTLVDGDGNYAVMKWKATNAEKVSISMIAANPSEVVLDEGAAQSVTVYGIRGGVYSNIILDNANLTFTSENSSIATFVNGVITGVAEGSTNVKVSDGTYVDVIEVTVV